MGNVRFNTDVDKTVDLNKNVQLNVDKNVFSNVQLQGSLATAEASADALGTGNGIGTPGQTTIITFDDFEDEQFVRATGVEGDGFPDPNQDGPILLATDVAGLERRIFVNVLDNDPGADPFGPPGPDEPSESGGASIGVSNPSPGRLAFSADDGSFANSLAEYTDIAGGAIVVDEDISNEAVLADPGNFLFRVNDVNFDPGTGLDGQPASTRVSLVVKDSDGDEAITTVAFVPGPEGQGFTGLDIEFPLAILIDEDLPLAVDFEGEIISGGGPGQGSIRGIGPEDDVDGDGEVVDLTDVIEIQILQEDRPDVPIDGNDFSSGFFPDNPDEDFDLFAFENLSTDGTDASVSDLEIIIIEPPVPGEGVLAETDTFAQVSEEGAFSFSEALAALSPLDSDTIA